MQSPIAGTAVAAAAITTAFLLDRIAAARYVGVSPKTMLRFATARRLPVYRMCRKLLFKKSDLERFVDKHVVAPRSSSRYERP